MIGGKGKDAGAGKGEKKEKLEVRVGHKGYRTGFFPWFNEGCIGPMFEDPARERSQRPAWNGSIPGIPAAVFSSFLRPGRALSGPLLSCFLRKGTVRNRRWFSIPTIILPPGILRSSLRPHLISHQDLVIVNRPEGGVILPLHPEFDLRRIPEPGPSFHFPAGAVG